MDHRDESSGLLSQQDVLRHGLSNLDFLVVQDGYHPTPTTELADLVLPAAIWGEKEGTYTNSERRVSKVNKAVEPPGEARPDFDIFLAVAENWAAGNLVSGLDQAGRRVQRMAAGFARAPVRLLRDQLRITGEQTERCSGRCARARRRNLPRGFTPTGFSDARWAGKVDLRGVGAVPGTAGRQYPFILNTGRTVEHWHTRTKTREVPILERLSPRAWLEINPRDAQRLGLRSHEAVDVISQRGRARGVELRLTEITAPGQVFMPFHFFETNVNEVTQSAFDPISREPNYKQCAVRVSARERGATNS